MKWRCSRCGKPLEGSLIQIKTQYVINEITEEGALIPYNNLSEPTSELVCQSCFDHYAEVINSLNNDYNNIYMSNMVEVIDDIQYANTEA